MNPLTNARNLAKINDREMEMGLSGTKSSWHEMYSSSAWIFVGGMPYDLSEGDIVCVFSQYGEICHINLIRDKDSGKSKGFGFICYEDQRSTILAVDNLNTFKLMGRTLRVDHVKDYKMPKEHDDQDDETKALHNEGCAPQMDGSDQEVSEQSEESEPETIEQKAIRRAEHKLRKAKKKKEKENKEIEKNIKKEIKKEIKEEEIKKEIKYKDTKEFKNQMKSADYTTRKHDFVKVKCERDSSQYSNKRDGISSNNHKRRKYSGSISPKDSKDKRNSRSPIRRRRSRSPKIRNRSRSPKIRNRSRSPKRKNRSRSPKIRNRSSSPKIKNRSRSRSPRYNNKSRSRTPPKRELVRSPIERNRNKSPRRRERTPIREERNRSDRRRERSPIRRERNRSPIRKKNSRSPVRRDRSRERSPRDKYNNDYRR